MNKMTNTQRIEKLENEMSNLNEKMDKILEALSGKATKTQSRGSAKAPKKDDYTVVATAKENRQKVYDAMAKDGKEYDRNTYKKYAKKLGVWSDTYNKVVGTYK